MPTRKAEAVWEGTLKGGNGKFKGQTGLSGAYNFSSRFEEGSGSNPEELLAAAHAACYSMALSGALEKNGTPSTSIKTEAFCTVEKVDAGFKITTIKLVTRATVPGIENAAFQDIAAKVKDGCPVSGALKAVPNIELDAALA
ncbi:MAG TPA: OsmC family peroxiredoxin [Polyangiaceae bacterium]|jgi:osmotically inducible protein OsmC|nr:OsmC family peroxiredoxin [Polyangiaceae bacterium]